MNLDHESQLDTIKKILMIDMAAYEASVCVAHESCPITIKTNVLAPGYDSI